MTIKEMQNYFSVKYSEEGVFAPNRWSKSVGIKPDPDYEFMKLSDITEPGMETFRVSHRTWIRIDALLFTTETIADRIAWCHMNNGHADYGFLFRRPKVKDDLIKIMGLKGIRLGDKSDILQSRYVVATRVHNINRVKLQGMDIGGGLNLMNITAYQFYMPDFGNMDGWRFLSKLERPIAGDEYMVWTKDGYFWFPVQDDSMSQSPIGSWRRHNHFGFYARRLIVGDDKPNAERLPLDMIPEVLINMIDEDSTNPTIRGMVRNLFKVVMPVEVMAKGKEAVLEFIMTSSTSVPDRYFAQFDGNAWRIEAEFVPKEYKIFGNDLPPVMVKVKYKAGWYNEGHRKWMRVDEYTGEMDVPDNIIKMGVSHVESWMRNHFILTNATLLKEGAYKETGDRETSESFLDSVRVDDPKALAAIPPEPVLVMAAGQDEDGDDGRDDEDDEEQG